MQALFKNIFDLAASDARVGTETSGPGASLAAFELIYLPELRFGVRETNQVTDLGAGLSGKLDNSHFVLLIALRYGVTIAS